MWHVNEKSFLKYLENPTQKMTLRFSVYPTADLPFSLKGQKLYQQKFLLIHCQSRSINASFSLKVGYCNYNKIRQIFKNWLNFSSLLNKARILIKAFFIRA